MHVALEQHNRFKWKVICLVIGIISGAEYWDSIEEFKNAKNRFFIKVFMPITKDKKLYLLR